MNTEIGEIYVYLTASPLFGLTLTLVAYQGALWLSRRGGSRPLLNPVLLAVLVIGVVLWIARIDYDTYFQGAQFVHFLLGPATVALAVPLYRELPRIRRAAVPILVAVLAGSLSAAASVVSLSWALGASPRPIVSLAPKSATTPVAMSLSEQYGGLPSLTAVFVILTGVIGAIVGRGVLDLVRIRDMAARGLAMGVASHGIGTARALEVDSTAGAFASLGLALNAVATAIVLPLVYWPAGVPG